MMQELEERANAVYWESPGTAHEELVAFGLVEPAEAAPDGVETISWWELKNTAEPNVDGRGEFYVDPEDYMPVLQTMAEHAGLLTLGMSVSRAIDALLLERVVILWHTHTGSISPSAEDIAEFPEWLADYGMVYHVPSDTSTLYNRAGIISNSSSTLARDS